MQGAQKGVHGSLSRLDHTFRRKEHTCSSVVVSFNRNEFWCCREEDGVTGNPCSRETF